MERVGGKQWQATPKNLPRMQRTSAIPVAWLSSGLCPDRPKGWIPIIIIIFLWQNVLYFPNDLRLSALRFTKCYRRSSFTFLFKDRKLIVDKHKISAPLIVLSRINHFKSTDTFSLSIIKYYICLFICNVRSAPFWKWCCSSFGLWRRLIL